MSRTNLPTFMWIEDDQSAKFWLEPVALARNRGFGPAELLRVHRLVVENRNSLLEKWCEYFPT